MTCETGQAKIIYGIIYGITFSNKIIAIKNSMLKCYLSPTFGTIDKQGLYRQRPFYFCRINHKLYPEVFYFVPTLSPLFIVGNGIYYSIPYTIKAGYSEALRDKGMGRGTQKLGHK